MKSGATHKQDTGHCFMNPPAQLQPFVGTLTLCLLFFRPSLALALGRNSTSGVEDAAPSNDTSSYSESYFTHPDHAGLIYAHILLMSACWVLVLPVAVVLSLAGSRLTLVSQYWFLALNALGLVLGTIYNSKTPNLYPNNAHGKVGWLISWVASAQVLLSLMGCTGAIIRSHPSYSKPPISGHLSSDLGTDRDRRLSSDSSQCTESQPKAAHLPPASSSREGGDYEALTMHGFDEDQFAMAAQSSPGVSRLPGDKITFVRVWQNIGIIYQLIDRIILPLGFVALATGLATFGRLFEGKAIFSGLAHWIKGGVFFWLGLFTLGRWAGSFGELGWAWNMPPTTFRRTWRPSAEWMESALIFVYGSTNIFLEHLGGWGGAWSAQDLEHIAITILFIGGGLCGMLVESAKVRSLLNTTVLEATGDPRSEPNGEGQLQRLDLSTYEFSLNPIPALVILLLGIIMSSHQQSTGMSMDIHRQWGFLLSGASITRCLTYILVFLRPPRSTLPSRPPTELLTSFALIAGGIIFMASSSDTIKGMMYYNLDSMFLYTVTMGLAGLLMAWVVVVLSIKGWASRREGRLGPRSCGLTRAL
ncbi:hypothetical protein XA68_10585 [Ophiocordyceps unilateralis]|uniref:Protein YTP1-like C-terminal domain-containing protein n=1 Tax=Ophiocordyceps unilateralis TaxID=268505 RepID=A0A2A9P2R0_OPHUN|nr:hypothetical protein XA68_10585 [Ophiocordyceps unilateralis]